MSIYQKRRACVDAEQWIPPGPDCVESLTPDRLGVLYLRTDFGCLNSGSKRGIPVHRGDWIVTSGGQVEVYSPTDFALEFEPVPDDMLDLLEDVWLQFSLEGTVGGRKIRNDGGLSVLEDIEHILRAADRFDGDGHLKAAESNRLTNEKKEWRARNDG